jgi:hypothetical protein
LYQPALFPVAASFAFCATDPRITRVGRWLRRHRLDERKSTARTATPSRTPKNLAPSLDAYIVFSNVKTALLGRGAQ